jgi:hypothetical protein
MDRCRMREPNQADPVEMGYFVRNMESRNREDTISTPLLSDERSGQDIEQKKNKDMILEHTNSQPSWNSILE